MIDFYGYKRCGTCRSAEKHLTGLGVEYRFIDITEQAPTLNQLKAALAADYELPELCNRSGVQYRELNMKDKLKALPESEILDLLAGNGRLCKRPFITDGRKTTVGWNAELLTETWS